jgi:hypothetical protein
MTWQARGGRQALGRARTRFGWRAVSVYNELPDKRIKVDSGLVEGTGTGTVTEEVLAAKVKTAVRVVLQATCSQRVGLRSLYHHVIDGLMKGRCRALIRKLT